jgi:MFS family permease
MIMAPLGDLLMKVLAMKPSQFGSAVSGYAFSAGIAGLLTAGFADRFDRKKLLLFFYIGFIAGTILCALANSYETLLAARIITGLFGGVIGSISLAIVADLFDIHHRGRVMGFVQMGFGASQVLGIPIGLYLANHLGMACTVLARSRYGYVDSGLDCCKTKTSNCSPCSTARPFTASPFTKHLLKKKLPHWLFSHRLSVYRRIYDDALQQCLCSQQPESDT